MTDVDELIAQAQAPETTPFDYIVVGSGAGGGPLAARLALAGKRVLVLEAGLDPGLPEAQGGVPVLPSNDGEGDEDSEREVYRVPAYHPAATEDALISWDYSVRHYGNNATQAKDPKYRSDKDPWPAPAGAQGGVQYPRCSALGGCTAHHAMIVVKPPVGDWNRIANLTGDDSWRAESMRGYFARIENCLYYTNYHGFVRRFLGWAYDAWRGLVGFISPRLQFDWGGHGFGGWQKTSFIDPLLVVGIALRDRTFRGVLLRVIFYLLRQGDLRNLLKRVLATQWVSFLDPNFGDLRWAEHPKLALIPIGTDGKRRIGVREHLRETARQHPDRLVILTGTHVTRVIFDADPPRGTPRAVGVEARCGLHLYDASPRYDAKSADAVPKVKFFAAREVILCAGTFNTPQLLMLSGIGEAEHLEQIGVGGLRNRDGGKVAPIVHLPGVGRNLQDRNEVSVITETKRDFSTLHNVSFRPGDENDPALKQWRKNGGGLYATNGGALAIFFGSRDRPYEDEPDLLIVGFPVAFRGYYWGWSDELLSKLKGDKVQSRRLWTWVILQAHTRNRGGTLQLRSTSPFQQPNINFHYFDEGCKDAGKDLAALVEGIQWVRRLNRKIKPFIEPEIQPGQDFPDDSGALSRWIQREAWGHHACGTCRIGRDGWRADPADLQDREAVVASDFRVHGVTGLRVVDASVFAEIPGYFIVTSVFMISEKAADVLLADRSEYPRNLRAAEAVVVEQRRAAALVPAPAVANPADADLPPDTVGLALSGGGIRSATFSLGVLQELARRDRLREVDFLSTVSGGGYIGAFLGKLFTRSDADAHGDDELVDKPRRVQNTLARTSSPEIWWLRAHANYISGEGRSDLTSNVGTIWRNLLAVHLCIGALCVAAFAALRWIADGLLERFADATLVGIPLSPWWWVPVLVIAIGLVPTSIGYWLAPPPGSELDHPRAAVYVWLFALVAAIAAFGVPELKSYAPGAVLILLLAWLAQEAVRWGTTDKPEQSDDIARNRITRAVGEILHILALCAGWVVLDTLARRAAIHRMLPPTTGGMVGIAAALPLLRALAMSLVRGDGKPRSLSTDDWIRRFAQSALAFVLLGFLLFALDVLVHSAFESSRTLGVWLLLGALGASLAIGQALSFPNSFSLQSLYAARLCRAFLGAANESRVHAKPANANSEVQAADPGDDVRFDAYDPTLQGGPLHLINACINETVDAASARPLRLDKGLPMCVGPSGVSVGRRFHALWEQERAVLRAIASGTDPNSFHVLAQRSGQPAPAEQLLLSQWISTSGAALGTGLGRHTNLPTSLLLGLFNIRLGYWWDSGIDAGARPGRYPPALLRRLKSSLGRIFRAQAMILNEWRGYFTGPSERLWYLSDGGHFEETGVYELIRRRVPLMICANATEGPKYLFDNTARLMRRARLDFGAHITWLDPIAAPAARDGGWGALDPRGEIPVWVRRWLEPDGIGSLWEIGHGSPQSTALARVRYDDDDTICWLLMINASSLGDMPLDLRSYAAANTNFPHDPTFNQFFTDEQWESYRQLGECAAAAVIRSPAVPERAPARRNSE